jgi:hypothetical protein
MTYPHIPVSPPFPQHDGSSRISDQQPVLVAAVGPARQSRATVAFRIILVIPHLVVLYFLAVAASVVAFIGWFGALFTGRLPDFAAAYLAGYVRWYCRVAAYLLLLTDEYPPFMFQDAAYPVRVAVSPSRLNRLAVFFRLALAIPAAILSTILLSGVGTIVIFIAWLTAVFAGKLPGSLHQAFVAVLRYSTRYYGYLYLLTDAYPRGLFGDKPGAGDRLGGPDYEMTGRGYGGPDPAYGRGAGYDARPGYGGPGYGGPDPAYGPAGGYDAPPGYGPPRRRTAVPGYGEQHGYQTGRVPRHRAAAVETPGRPASWQMVLSASAKRVVGLILVLGLVTTVGEGIAATSGIGYALHRRDEVNQLSAAIAENNKAIDQNQKAIAQVSSAVTGISSAHRRLGSQLNRVVDASRACTTVSCFDAEAVRAASAIAVLGRRLHAVAIPHTSASAERKFASDVTRYKHAWMGMSHATSFTDYANRARSAEKAGARFDRDYKALAVSLDNLGAALNRQAAVLNQRTASLKRQAASLNVG